MEGIGSECVQLDGLVLLKIIKHCRQNLPDAVSGHLLGLDVKEKLEVTGCFPMPAAASSSKAAREEADAEEYQMAMMKLLREVNADANTVGWYQVRRLRRSKFDANHVLLLVDLLWRHDAGHVRCLHMVCHH